MYFYFVGHLDFETNDFFYNFKRCKIMTWDGMHNYCKRELIECFFKYKK